MTVRELIGELLDCDMDTEVILQIKLADMDLEYEKFEVEIEKTGGGWGKNAPYLSVDLEHKTSENFIED
ncbi:hypothetical protein BKM15_25810 [Pseudomonas syringae pv. syringae]|nr:hypothetical protein BKM15_25810 [Pseudomonas syringae pv. syringae]